MLFYFSFCFDSPLSQEGKYAGPVPLKNLKAQIYKENQLNRNFCPLFFNKVGVKFVTLRPNLKKA